MVNRGTEINAMTGSISWYYCSSKDNPANLLTREARINFTLDNSVWFKGPNVLEDDDLRITNETINVPENVYLSD